MQTTANRYGGRQLVDSDGYRSEAGTVMATMVTATTELGQGRFAFSEVRRGGSATYRLGSVRSTIAELEGGGSTINGLKS